MAERILKYYTFPDNNAYGASIPISSMETPFAIISTNVDAGNQVSLRVTVGWEAVKYGEDADGKIINRTDILFSLWRGAPISGTLICSAMDSGEPDVDNNKTITFSQYEDDFTESQLVTYTLTARSPLYKSQANIIGGLTVVGITYK